MNDRKDPILYIVIPCYNEQEVLPITAPLIFAENQRAWRRLGRSAPTARDAVVNDGSRVAPGRSSTSWRPVMNTMSVSVRAATVGTRTLCWRA